MPTRGRLSPRAITGLSCALALAVLGACSGPSGGKDDADVSATSTTIAGAEPTSTPSARVTVPSTATASPTASATPAAPTATNVPATPTAATSVTATIAVPTVTPAATATPIPLPAGGAELRILGKAVRQIVAADAEGQILYGITGVGLSRSRDGGRVWSAAGDAQEGTLVAALNDPDVLYAGDKASCAFGTTRTPLVRSVDGGETWETFAAGESIQPLLVWAGEHSKLVGTNCTLQLSSDGGQTWKFVALTSGYDVSTAATSSAALDDELVAIGTSEGGTSIVWKFDMSTFDAPVLIGEIARFHGPGAVAWTGERLVLATSTGVGVSDDGGVTWNWSRAGLESITYSVDPLTTDIPEAEMGRPFGFSIARIDPSNPGRIWVGGALGAYRSDDGGQTWHQLGDESSIDSLVISIAVDRVYVSSDGGTRAWTLDGH